MENSHVSNIGFWASIGAAFLGFAYSVAQLLSTAEIIPHPQDLFWLFLPSLFLAPFFLVVMVCLNFSVKEELRIWTAIASAFAIVYCTMVTLVYFIQLAVVLPSAVKGFINDKSVLWFDRKTFLMAIDCLGYFFMSVSTFVAAFAFAGGGSKWLYRGLLWNGALMPVLVLAFFHPVYYYVGSLWMITFPLAMINAAMFFSKTSRFKMKVSFEYEIREK